MSNINDVIERRRFLKVTSALGAAALIGLPLGFSTAKASDTNAPVLSNAQLVTSQVFHVKIRGNLYDSPVDIDAYPGVLSGPLQIKGRGSVRIRVTPAQAVNPKFGPVYLLTITDLNGKLLDSMKIGSNTTATFQDIGLQVYLISVQVPKGDT